MTISRKPPGTPAGGEFAVKAHAEPSSDVLADDTPDQRIQRGLAAARDNVRSGENDRAVNAFRLYAAKAIYPGIDWLADEDDPASDNQYLAWAATGAVRPPAGQTVDSCADSAQQAHDVGMRDEPVLIARYNLRQAIKHMMAQQGEINDSRLLAVLEAARPNLPDRPSEEFVARYRQEVAASASLGKIPPHQLLTTLTSEYIADGEPLT